MIYVMIKEMFTSSIPIMILQWKTDPTDFQKEEGEWLNGHKCRA